VQISENQQQQAIQWKASVDVKEIEKLRTAYAAAYDWKTRKQLVLTTDLIKIHETYLNRCSWPDFDTFKFHQSKIWSQSSQI